MLRSFGKHGVHKGTITSYDDEGKLKFRVEYEDGDFEDLSEVDVHATLIDRGILRVSARSQRDKNSEDSDSDYFEDNGSSSTAVTRVAPSQASTQPLPLTLSDEPSQPTTVGASVGATAAPLTSNRKRSTPPVRQRSDCTLWVPSPCPVSITVHYNAVDRAYAPKVSANTIQSLNELWFGSIRASRGEELNLDFMQQEFDRGYKKEQFLIELDEWNGLHRGTHPRTPCQLSFPFTFGHPNKDPRNIDDRPWP